MYLRGATTCFDNVSSVQQRSEELFAELLKANDKLPSDVSAVLFTVTDDVTCYNPCTAVRLAFNLNDVAFMCMQEAAINRSVPYCLRVLVVTADNLPQSSAKFVYLHGAADLRK